MGLSAVPLVRRKRTDIRAPEATSGKSLNIPLIWLELRGAYFSFEVSQCWW